MIPEEEGEDYLEQDDRQEDDDSRDEDLDWTTIINGEIDPPHSERIVKDSNKDKECDYTTE